MENFGERLRRLRGNRSQRKIASEMGKPQTTLSTLENQSAAPRGKVLEELANFYGVPVSYFLAESGPTDKAREWLRSVRQTNCRGKETVATHAESPVADTEKEVFAKWIDKIAQASDKL
jgi:transcriptional regulator with XRE-family HTH domain